MNLYFGNIISTISTILIIIALLYIAFTIDTHKKVTYWGRKIAALAIFGLVVCCFVATRDEYYLSVQASVDSSISEGRFAYDSIQSTLCCIGGAIIALSSLSSIFVKNQKYRKIMFYILSFAFILKFLIIEISRLVVEL